MDTLTTWSLLQLSQNTQVNTVFPIARDTKVIAHIFYCFIFYILINKLKILKSIDDRYRYEQKYFFYLDFARII